MGLLAWAALGAAPVSAQSDRIPVVVVLPMPPLAGLLPHDEGGFGPVLQSGRASVAVDIDRSSQPGQAWVR